MKDRLPPAEAALFAQVAHDYYRHGHVTTDELAASLKWSKSTVHKHLTRLRERGLVSWTTGLRGTLRPNAQVFGR